MTARVIYTPPHTFATISGYQPASLLDDMFYAVQNADVTLKTNFLTASYTMMPSDNYSKFLCQPVADMTLFLPPPSNYFSFQFFNATATTFYTGTRHNVTLEGTVVVDGVSKVNPVFPDANNVIGGLVMWDGSQWQMWATPFGPSTIAFPLASNSGGTGTAFRTINAHEYGAFGDDSHDDTTSIQNAINALQGTPGGGILYFNKGIFRISSTLNIADENVILQGIGPGEARLYNNTE